MANVNGNLEFKSDVFSMLMQDKRRALEVYNAINGTAYADPDQVEMTTLYDRSFSLTVRNDASFILDANLSLYEHQSTYCPNMPLRDLIYFTEMIYKKIDRQKRDIYGKRLIKIPTPHFVVFYNGKENAPEHYELRLSDAFEHKTGQPELELICQVYNINRGKNTELLSKCPTLRDYMYFVDLVRQYAHDPDVYNLEKAIQLAIDQCIREDVLKEFLQERGKEVMNVMTLDFTFERRLELQRAEAAEEGEKIGRVQGEKIGIHKILSEQIRKKLLKNKSLEQIADELEETPENIQPIYEQIQKELMQNC